MTVATDAALAFAAMRTVMAAQAVTLTFTNPTVASVAGLLQWTRRIPRDHDARSGPVVEIECKFHVLASAVTLADLHADHTTISDGTNTWRLREQPEAQEGYVLALHCWRAADYSES
jgi:hypothetical protein